MTDAHAHILEYGFMTQLPLAGTTSVQGGFLYVFKSMVFHQSNSEIVERIKAYIMAHPEVLDDNTKWIEGMGWDQTKWDDAQFPTFVRELDANPVKPCAPLTFRIG